MGSGTRARLPGDEIVERGLEDLEQGRASREALLLSRFAARLAAAGVPLPMPLDRAEQRLYELLAATDGDGAHSAYNALTRRIVSYLRAAERASRH